jgi:hypothetical protein
MTPDEIIAMHEAAIEIQWTIKQAWRKVELYEDSLRGVARYFPDLVNKYRHNIDIALLAIDRLKLRHERLVDKINNY